VAELTRFDFHVNRFLHSDDVESMTAEEVGQYILLLCHSFVKDEASLPDDPAVLARYARVKRVSDLVMKKFPLMDVNGTPRRQNPVLYTEWKLAKKRSENGRSAVAERWEKDSNTTVSTDVIRPYNESKPVVDTHTIPYQSIPDQPTPTHSSSFNTGTWKTLAIRFRGALGKFISSTKTNKQKYAEFCSQYGEDAVLKVFDEWIDQNKSWLSEKDDALFFFWKNLPELIDAVSSEKEQQEPEIPQEEIAAAMIRQSADRQKEIAKELEELIKAEKWAQEHREEI